MARLSEAMIAEDVHAITGFEETVFSKVTARRPHRHDRARKFLVEVLL